MRGLAIFLWRASRHVHYGLVILTLALCVSLVVAPALVLPLAAEVVWLVIFALALFLLAAALLLYTSFVRDVMRKEREGRPYLSVRGVRAQISLLRGTVYKYALLAFITATSYAWFKLGLVLPAALYLAVGTLFIIVGLGTILAPELAVFRRRVLIEAFLPHELNASLDFIMSEALENMLDPALYLRWDDLLCGLARRLGSAERARHALEKYLYLTYLRLRLAGALSEDVVRREMLELVDEGTYEWLVNNPYLPRPVLEFIIRRMLALTPEFSWILDRLYIDLSDRPALVARSPLIAEAVATPRVTVGGVARLLVFLYNNNPSYASKPWRVIVRVVAEGFEPSSIVMKVPLEQYPGLRIPEKTPPLYSDGKNDIVGVMRRILEAGDMLWLRLTPTRAGKLNVVVTVETEDGEVLWTRVLTVESRYDVAGAFRRLFGGGTILTGIAYPLLRLLGLPVAPFA